MQAHIIPETFDTNHRPTSQKPGIRAVLRLSSLLALTLAAPAAFAQATPASAAEADDDDTVILGEFNVYGVRASLIGAQEIKRNSPQLVDSIVAEDIGKLPDNSVADALQRIPGIQVGKANGEVNTVLIRGLPNLGTTLNGNEIFTGTSRGLALQDIPAELVAGVDVYKSTSPELVEGGIAGLIDVRLRKPLDFDKPQFAAGARMIYGENAEKTGYVGSLLLSDRWQAGEGEFGILYSGAYQQRYFVDQTAFNFNFEPVGIPEGLVDGVTTIQMPFTQGSLIIPGDRKRFAHNLSMQWKVSDELQFYNDFLNTGYRNKNQVHFLIGLPRFGAFTAAEVLPGTNIAKSTTSVNNFHLTSTQAFANATDGFHDVLGMKWSRGANTFTNEFMFNKNKVKNKVLIVDTQFAPATPGTFFFNNNDGGRANLTITGTDVTDPDSYRLWGLFDNRDYADSEQIGWKAQLDHAFSDGFIRAISGGFRWTQRSVDSEATNRADIAPADGRGTRVTSTIPGFGSVNPDGPLDYYGTKHWYGASPAYLYSQPDAVRALFGLPDGPAPYVPTLAFNDDEGVKAGFINAKYKTELGGKSLDGTLGVRVAQTTQSLRGFYTDGTPVDSDKTETDVLPVLNARLQLTDEFTLRFAAGRTITRPNFSDLNPMVTLTDPTTTGGSLGTGNGGNPDLKNVTSDNYDLSLEYYFDKSGYVAATLFHRDITGYVGGQAQSERLTNPATGVTADYSVSRPRNTGDGKLDGFEIAYQQFPEMLRGFGWMANYTFVDGEMMVPNVITGVFSKNPFAEVSRHNYNIILVYERKKFSTRLAYNKRGEYTLAASGPNAPGSELRQLVAKPMAFLDFSCSYNVNEHFTISLDATNLLAEEYQNSFHDTRYPRDTVAYDRTVSLGIRYRYWVSGLPVMAVAVGGASAGRHGSFMLLPPFRREGRAL